MAFLYFTCNGVLLAYMQWRFTSLHSMAFYYCFISHGVFICRYSMVFVPFTGIDNHHCNVTFGAALLASETADTYIWLLRVFLKAVGSQPKVVVTDQDPAMKKAISVVFVDTRHRLCMWHVMHKLSLKVVMLFLPLAF